MDKGILSEASVAKPFLGQLIGPSGVVRVNGKPQQFVEIATDGQALEQRMAEQKLDIDPLFGSRLYKGQFLGCWVPIRELPNPQGKLELE